MIKLFNDAQILRFYSTTKCYQFDIQMPFEIRNLWFRRKNVSFGTKWVWKSLTHGALEKSISFKWKRKKTRLQFTSRRNHAVFDFVICLQNYFPSFLWKSINLGHSYKNKPTSKSNCLVCLKIIYENLDAKIITTESLMNISWRCRRRLLHMTQNGRFFSL